MACAGAVTANVLTAGAGMVGNVGGDVLKSTSGITNSIKDATTGLTGSVSMASFTSNQAACLLYTSPSPRDRQKSRMPSSA